MENLRSGELYVFSDNEFFNPPSYAVVSGWACDGISLSVLMTESPLPEPSMRIDWDCRLPHGLSYSRLPTDAEAQLIKDMITEKLREEYGQTPKEFCEDVGGIEIGGMTQ